MVDLDKLPIVNGKDTNALSKDLKKLVVQFEKKPKQLSEVDQQYVKKFGFAALANSLMYIGTRIPHFEKEKVAEFVKSHTFPELQTFVDYVKSLKNDIDKMYAIFCWEAFNVTYEIDSDAFSAEAVFKTRSAKCEGYARFFVEVANLAGVNSKYQVQKFSNFSKGKGYNPLNVVNPPPSSDHASIFCMVNGAPFIIEPTWAAGYEDSDTHKFVEHFEPGYFLIPIYKALNIEYPVGDSQKLLDFNFELNDFLRTMKISPGGVQLKTESHPFAIFTCTDGFLEQQYSCIAPITCIIFRVSKLIQKNGNDIFQELHSKYMTSYKIISKSIKGTVPKRMRFMTYIAFPEKGFYKVNLFINTHGVAEYYVVNEKGTSISVPLSYDFSHDSKFIPITPKNLITKVNDGVSLIRFASAVHRSRAIWDIYRLDKNTDGSPTFHQVEKLSRKLGNQINLLIPFDYQRYEIQLTVTYPSNGYYQVMVYLNNDNGNYTSFISYYFEVKGATKQEPVFPTKYLYQGREFAPLYLTDNHMYVYPGESAILINSSDELERTIEIDTPNGTKDSILLNFKYASDGQTIFPKFVKSDGNTSTYQWTIPREGVYNLLGFINDNYIFGQQYEYRKDPLRTLDETEQKLMKELENNIKFEDNIPTSARIQSPRVLESHNSSRKSPRPKFPVNEKSNKNRKSDEEDSIMLIQTSSRKSNKNDSKKTTKLAIESNVQQFTLEPVGGLGESRSSKCCLLL